MEEIVELFKKHSLNIVVLGFVVIFAIGVLKYFKLFKKVQSADIRKAIYIGLNIAFSFGFGALYTWVFKIGFGSYLALVAELVPVVLVEYAIYENVGLRKLMQFMGNYIVGVVAKNKVEAEKDKIKTEQNAQIN